MNLRKWGLRIRFDFSPRQNPHVTGQAIGDKDDFTSKSLLLLGDNGHFFCLAGSQVHDLRSHLNPTHMGYLRSHQQAIAKLRLAETGGDIP